MSSFESIPAQVVQLQVLLGAALERIRQLEQENEGLTQENARLRERLGQNSTNSSRPPSSDPPGTRRTKKKKRRGRRPGGQPGTSASLTLHQ